jgi:hypothetical protein
MSDSEDVQQLKIAVAQLTLQLQILTKQAEKQQTILEDLVAMANKGKGSIWMFMAMGGIIGAILSNAKAFVDFALSRP